MMKTDKVRAQEDTFTCQTDRLLTRAVLYRI